MKIPTTPALSPAKQVTQRWTTRLIEAGGFTPISIFFLENYTALPKPLNHAEAMLVIHLMRHKFDKDAPYPGFTTIAKRMGVTPTAVRGYARSLERKGYLRRQMRTAQTNKFYLEPLFRALEELMEPVRPHMKRKPTAAIQADEAKAEETPAEPSSPSGAVRLRVRPLPTSR